MAELATPHDLDSIGRGRRRRLTSVLLSMLAVWLCATAWNLDKAFHIDDTAHLEIAQWIADHPLRPMSGLLHWESQDESKPIHDTNQPHLYFYAMAGWGSVFGWSERSMHVLMSIFALGAIVAMYGLATAVGARSPTLLAAFLGLGPAFVVGQNTMVDIPLLAAWLVFYWALLSRSLSSELARYSIAAATCSAAILVKYASLALLPVLVAHIVVRRRFDLLYVVALPVLVLLGWSAFNWLDYGGIHLLDRETTVYSAAELVDRLLAWFVSLGAISPFAVYFYLHASSRLPRRWERAVKSALLALFVALVALAFGFWRDAFSADTVEKVLLPVFMANGIAFVGLAIAAPLLLARKQLGLADATLAYWLFSAIGLIVVLAPAIATRHVLLALPALLVLGARWQREFRPRWAAVALTLTIALTIPLASSDRSWADVYREQARVLREALPRGAKVWFTGTWGWKWYAEQNGMQQVDLRYALPRSGDFVVEPRTVSPTSDGGVPLSRRGCELVPRGGVVPSISTAGMYTSSLETLPWTLRREPIEEFCTYRVRAR